MAKQPIFLGLDRYDVTPRVDVIEAQIALLQNAEARQHALMTKHGGAPIFVDFVSIQTSNTTIVRGIPVPPGVLYVDLGLRLFGIGDVVITSAVDGTGTMLSVRGDTAVTMAEHAEMAWTSGVQPASMGAGSGRALQVASSVSWSWQDVEIELSIQGVSTRCGIVGMVLVPIHQPV